LNIPIPPTERKLTVSATPRDKALEPGGETSVDLDVKDATGKPVQGSEVALVVVDEAILSLTNYKLADPLAAFYQERGGDTNDYHSRATILLANTRDLESMKANGQPPAPPGQAGRGMMAQSVAAPMAARAMMRKEGVGSGSGAGPGQTQPIRTREDFNALAVFAPSEKTDADGHVTVDVKLPDNLTRYRVMAVAVAGGKQFGSAESAITARLPLMLRPSPPRFLNYGDKFELPVVVQNQTDSPMKVDVAVRATNCDLTAGAGRRVTVPANDRVEVRFPAAAVRAGTARFQVGASSGKWADASEFQLPVWTPATTEAFATYGEIDSGGLEQPVRAPSDAIADFGGLEITTSSTQLQALTDAVLYLQAYRFECSEQLSSRIMAVAELKDVLTAFHAEGLPKPDEMIAAVNRDIKRLQGMQNGDGGFGFWERGDESWPYLSVHVAHALERAKLKNFDVPSSTVSSVKNYLVKIDSHIPAYYPKECRWAIESYALYVRNLMGDRVAADARSLVSEAGLQQLSLESQGWLLSVMSGDTASASTTASIRKNFNNKVAETAGAANFVESYTDGEHLLLHSNRRTDAVVLDALITDQPKNDLIPKIVRGLLAHRVAGHWNNTQENCFVLIAMDRYFHTYENIPPDFVARAWLGEGYAGEHAFKGRSTDSYEIDVPMRYLKDHTGNQDLILAKDGPGRLYYRIGMRYAPSSLDLKPADYGFAVARTYEAVDNPADVRRDSNGTWHIKAGARVRVRIQMVAQSRRYHVALVDPMPAGFEAMNPELAVTGSIPTDPKEQQSLGRWWW
ncbi:MAG: alpha-2-macroglobulin family protein, partial [Blastocatellia bacterium]